MARIVQRDGGEDEPQVHDHEADEADHDRGNGGGVNLASMVGLVAMSDNIDEPALEQHAITGATIPTDGGYAAD